MTAATSQSSYAADEEPVLELQVQNSSSQPCTADVSPAQQAFTVTSGSGQVFSTRDCPTEAGPLEIVLEPEGTETARFTWPRIHSAPNCAEAPGEPDPGTYQLQVSLGEVESEPVEFTLQ